MESRDRNRDEMTKGCVRCGFSYGLRFRDDLSV